MKIVIFIILCAFLLFVPAMATDIDELSDAWVIKCNVNGAEVVVEGETVGYIEDNELIIPCTSPYEQFMIVRGSGFEEIWQTLHPPMSGTAEIVNIWIEDAPVSEDMGSVKIDSTPRGAKVYYQEDYMWDGDYKVVGYTPVIVDYTAIGWHRVRVWKEGYELESQRILVTSGKTPTDNWFKLVPGESKDPRLEPTPIPTPTSTPEPAPTFEATPEITAAPTEIPIEDNGGGSLFTFTMFLIMLGAFGGIYYVYRVSGIAI